MVFFSIFRSTTTRRGSQRYTCSQVEPMVCTHDKPPAGPKNASHKRRHAAVDEVLRCQQQTPLCSTLYVPLPQRCPLVIPYRPACDAHCFCSVFRRVIDRNLSLRDINNTCEAVLVVKIASNVLIGRGIKRSATNVTQLSPIGAVCVCKQRNHTFVSRMYMSIFFRVPRRVA
jgi:hypothetical protein